MSGIVIIWAQYFPGLCCRPGYGFSFFVFPLRVIWYEFASTLIGEEKKLEPILELMSWGFHLLFWILPRLVVWGVWSMLLLCFLGSDSFLQEHRGVWLSVGRLVPPVSSPCNWIIFLRRVLLSGLRTAPPGRYLEVHAQTITYDRGESTARYFSTLGPQNIASKVSYNPYKP